MMILKNNFSISYDISGNLLLSIQKSYMQNTNHDFLVSLLNFMVASFHAPGKRACETPSVSHRPLERSFKVTTQERGNQGQYELSISSTGLCYGLVNAAIANFNHADKQNWWHDQPDSIFEGIGERWKKTIEKHWDNDKSHANEKEPYKPFSTNNIYKDEYAFMTGWTDEAAKKIMYYFVGQSFFFDWSKTDDKVDNLGQ